MSWKTGSTVGGVAALFVIGYALLLDLMNGLEFTSAARSWPRWFLGLLVIGVVALALEGAWEWAFASREFARPHPRRLARIVVALAVALAAVAVAALTMPYLVRRA
jgi:hypothetical protein